jgi:hypothetical protein
MYKFLYGLSITLLFAVKGNAQTTPVTDPVTIDSMAALKELYRLLDSAGRPVSYAYASFGVGNRLFSINNTSLNARQSNTSKIIYSPAVGYFHKSGFGLTAGLNLLNGEQGFGVNQYSLSPSYDVTGSKYINAGISYTRYFVKDKFSSFSSPIQNDLFASLGYKKSWLQPGVAVGYSTGEYNDYRYKDTVILGVRRRLYDSINYQLKVFSAMLTLSHQFNWYGVLDKNDGLGFTPTLMANAGSGNTVITHNTNALALFNFLSKRGRIPRLVTEQFELQSFGLSLNVNYSIGNFVFQPQLYLDYYLPETTANRFSPVAVFNIGYSF